MQASYEKYSFSFWLRKSKVHPKRTIFFCERQWEVTLQDYVKGMRKIAKTTNWHKALHPALNPRKHSFVPPSSVWFSTTGWELLCPQNHSREWWSRDQRVTASSSRKKISTHQGSCCCPSFSFYNNMYLYPRRAKLACSNVRGPAATSISAPLTCQSSEKGC